MNIKNLKPNKNAKTRQGYYNISESKKYFGKEKKVIYRSSWEYMFCDWCERNDKVVKWASESIAINYYCPINKKMKVYYPDFTIKINTNDIWVVEVKPEKEYKNKPELPKRKTKKAMQNYEYLLKTFYINNSKFKYAKEHCKSRGWKFFVADENWFGLKKK